MFGTLFKQIEQKIADHCKLNEKGETFPTLCQRNQKLKKIGRRTEEEKKEESEKAKLMLKMAA